MKKNINVLLKFKNGLLFLIITFSLHTLQAANHYDELFNQYSLNIHNKTKALEYAREYLTKAKKEKDKQNKLIGYSLLAGIQNNVQSSMVYIDSMFAITSIHDTKNLVFCYTTKGRVLFNKRFLKDALTNFIIAKIKIDKSNLTKEAEIDYYIASIKNIQGNTTEALQMFLKLKDFYLQSNDHNSYMESLISIADCYFRKNRLAQSYQYVAKGKKIANIHQDLIYDAYFESIHGKILFKQGKLELAIKKLKQANISLEQYDPINFAENSFYIAECYKLKHDLPQAVLFYKIVDKVFVSNNYMYSDILAAYDRLIAYYEKENNLNRVLYYTKQKAKADSLLFSNNKYVSESMFKNIELKEVEHKNNIKLQNIILLSTGIIFLLLCLFYYFFNYQKNKEIVLENQHIELENKINNLETQPKQLADVTILTRKKRNDVNNQLDKKKVNELLKKLERFENENRFINPKCSLDSLAKELGTNSTYLSKIINEEKKVNFPTYLNNLRIDYLDTILRTNSKFHKYSIKALALEIGYNNVQSFSRAFLSRKGINASTYLEQIVYEESTQNKN